MNICTWISRAYRREKKEAVPFRILFAEFKKSLELNNRILDLIADANDKLSGDYIFDGAYIQATCRELSDLMRQLIGTINLLTRHKYSGLYSSFHLIEGEISALLHGQVLGQVKDLVLSYRDISRDLIDSVGGKNAHIAEIGKLTGIRIPYGFAITTAAFSMFLAENNLQDDILAVRKQWRQREIAAEEAAQKLQHFILDADVPPKLEKEILASAKRMARRYNYSTPCFAVRSSAIGEDESSSFAGQYLSRLNISLDELPQAYKEVLASLFAPEALEYRLEMDFRTHEIMMAVACQLMIPARASGVMYTYDPVRPERETMIVNSAWGLGAPIVAGEVPSDHFILDRQPPNEVLESQIVSKDEAVFLQGSHGMGVDRVAEDLRTAPSLTDQQLRELARIGIQLEKYFKRPQDIEFAVDQEDKIIILQARQLRLQQQREPRASDLADLGNRYPVLLRGRGIAAMEGVATGPAWVSAAGRALNDFPMGGILVARHATPQLARVIQRAAGFITDIGATTGHLATVAREFRVPALFNTENGTEVIADGEVITLDTESLTVYKGAVQELQYYAIQEEPIEEMYEYRLLRRVLKKIEPLNLTDPAADNFTPRACRTYHDLTRFVHEKAVETIIDLNFYHAHHKDSQAGQLLWEYPLDLILIDVGGGIEGEHSEGVRPEQISSVPMQALLRGMSYPGMWDMAPAGVDFSSFMSSLTRTTSVRSTAPEDVGRNLAVVSAEYTNINFRLGYHYTVIDAFISENILDNHIYFRFSGGVTETIRRSRRTRLLARILSYYDFLCEVHGDIVVGRLKKTDRERMLHRLFLLGLLVGFTRQLDIKMVSEETIDIFFNQIKAVMDKEYGI